MSKVMELKRLNDIECNTIIRALQLLADSQNKTDVWSAKVLLEDDAEFVRGLFWTSKTK